MKNKFFLLAIAMLMIIGNSTAQKVAKPAKAPEPDSNYYKIDFSNMDSPSPDKSKKEEPAKAKKDTSKWDVNSDYLLDFSKFDWGTGSTSELPKSVKIGQQTWTAKNLDVSNFRNGDVIPEAKTKEEWLAACNAKKPAWCYYNNDAANGTKYGKLYNWYAVKDSRGLAPVGWHVPSETEWGTLIYQLGGDAAAGKKMRSTSGWKEGGNGTNESGFDALAGSRRSNYATFYELGSSGWWWSSTPFITGSAGYGFQIEWYGIVSKNIYDNDGLYVRCVKD